MGSHFVIIFLLIKYISPFAALWERVFRVTKLFFFLTQFDNYIFRRGIPLNPEFGRVLRVLIDFNVPEQNYLKPTPPLLCWGLHFSSGLAYSPGPSCPVKGLCQSMFLVLPPGWILDLCYSFISCPVLNCLIQEFLHCLCLYFLMVPG